MPSFIKLIIRNRCLWHQFLAMGLETGKIVIYSWQENALSIVFESDQQYGRK